MNYLLHFVLFSRCSQLSDWMEDILINYYALPSLAARLSLLSFLKLDKHVNEKLQGRMSVGVTISGGSSPSSPKGVGIGIGSTKEEDWDDVSKIVAL